LKRKDYELIGKVISGLRGTVENTNHCPVKVLVWGNFAPALEAANANFDADQFKASCHID